MGNSSGKDEEGAVKQLSGSSDPQSSAHEPTSCGVGQQSKTCVPE